MIKTDKLLPSESISLSKEISLVALKDTPLMSLLLAKNKVESANGKIHSWRTRDLDSTNEISQPEGSETTVFQESGRAELNNVLQIFKKASSISGTMQAINIEGQSNLFASEINDRLTEMKVNVEQQLINSQRNDGSVSPFVRKMDGLLQFVDPANKVTGKTIGKITEDEIKATVRKLWEQGLPTGEYFAMVNADIKEQIDALFKDSYSYVAQQSTFGLIADTVRTNYGNINILLNRHMPTDKLVVFDPDFLALSYLRQPQFEPLAKTGDSVKGHVLAELTLKVANKKALAEYTLKA